MTIKDNISVEQLGHDIRTSLNAISGFNAMAQMNAHDPEKVKEYLAKSSQACNNLLDIVDKVLDSDLSQNDSSILSGTPADIVGRRVLLVDDNALNREIAKYLLESQGLIVEEAEDGDVAVRKIEDVTIRGEYEYYDFVLMDLQMPRMSGFQATEAIRRIPAPQGAHLPIIAMTANAFEEVRRRALECGMDEYLPKPIDIQKLLDTLSRCIQ